MHEHGWRQEPRHKVIGQPNDSFPTVADMCGHVDEEARQVCILNAIDHRAFVSVGPTFEEMMAVIDRKGKRD